MKKLQLSLFLFFATFTIYSQQYYIYGTITGFKDGTEIKLFNRDSGLKPQITKIEKNQFKFINPSINSPVQLYLSIKFDNKFNSFSFLTDNNDVTIFGSKNDFPNNFIVTGSKSNNLKIKYFEYVKPLQSQYDSLNNLIGQKKLDTIKYSKIHLNSERKKRGIIEKKLNTFKINYILNNPNSYYSIIEIYYNRQNIKKSKIKKIYNKLDEELKNSKFGINLKTYLNIKKVLKEGDYLEDFKAKDSSNVFHYLSEYQGKYILLDFIQTSCQYCVASNAELKIIFNEYKNSLQIITFSGDSEEQVWRDGLKEHEINWVSLWNGEDTNGKIFQKYGSFGTPNFFLIDPNGKIIKIISGYGEGELTELVSKILIKDKI